MLVKEKMAMLGALWPLVLACDGVSSVLGEKRFCQVCRAPGHIQVFRSLFKG